MEARVNERTYEIRTGFQIAMMKRSGIGEFRDGRGYCTPDEYEQLIRFNANVVREAIQRKRAALVSGELVTCHCCGHALPASQVIMSRTKDRAPKCKVCIEASGGYREADIAEPVPLDFERMADGRTWDEIETIARHMEQPGGRELKDAWARVTKRCA